MRLAEMLRGARGLEWTLLAIGVVLALLLLLRGGGEASAPAPTALEERLAATLSAVQGAGDVRVFVSEEEGGGPRGVLVVAQGAGDLRVQLALQQAVHAILQVELNNIEVLAMEAEEGI